MRCKGRSYDSFGEDLSDLAREKRILPKHTFSQFGGHILKKGFSKILSDITLTTQKFSFENMTNVNICKGFMTRHMIWCLGLCNLCKFSCFLQFYWIQCCVLCHYIFPWFSLISLISFLWINETAKPLSSFFNQKFALFCDKKCSKKW